MGRVEFPRLGAVDIIRASHFQQKQSSIAFLGVTLGVTPIKEKSKCFSCNGFSRLFGARPGTIPPCSIRSHLHSLHSWYLRSVLSADKWPTDLPRFEHLDASDGRVVLPITGAPPANAATVNAEK
jgi:hypothetical protein